MLMTNNFNGWVNNIQDKLLRFSQKKREVVIGIAIQCLADLQQESPVDYGRYRAAHTLSIMEPSSFIPPDVSVGEKQGHIQGQQLGKYSQLAQGQVNDALVKMSNIVVKNGLKIYITNNLDYAQYIEDGSYSNDPQAPKQIYGIVSLRFHRILQQELAKAG